MKEEEPPAIETNLQQAYVRLGAERLFPERDNDILDDRGCGIENPAVIGGDQRHDHQKAEEPHQPDGSIFRITTLSII